MRTQAIHHCRTTIDKDGTHRFDVLVALSAPTHRGPQGQGPTGASVIRLVGVYIEKVARGTPVCNCCNSCCQSQAAFREGKVCTQLQRGAQPSGTTFERAILHVGLSRRHAEGCGVVPFPARHRTTHALVRHHILFFKFAAYSDCGRASQLQSKPVRPGQLSDESGRRGSLPGSIVRPSKTSRN